jgi:hypothetical protein
MLGGAGPFARMLFLWSFRHPEDQSLRIRRNSIHLRLQGDIPKNGNILKPGVYSRFAELHSQAGWPFKMY